MSAEELHTNLKEYKIQLEQVEAALISSPNDTELLTLKHDLEQVVDLTKELIKSQLPNKDDSNSTELLVESTTNSKTREWIPGDRCLAIWIDNGQYHEATIESVEGEAISVLFDDFDNPVVTTAELLKEIPGDRGKIRKQPPSKLKEYQKKKKMKKQQRFKQLEEERESEKNKWLAFSSKTYKKGISKKSIFASPDNVSGRVGIGTCGVSGRGMTEYQSAEKYKK